MQTSRHFKTAPQRLLYRFKLQSCRFNRSFTGASDTQLTLKLILKSGDESLPVQHILVNRFGRDHLSSEKKGASAVVLEDSTRDSKSCLSMGFQVKTRKPQSLESEYPDRTLSRRLRLEPRPLQTSIVIQPK